MPDAISMKSADESPPQTVQCVDWKEMPKAAFDELKKKLDGSNKTTENGYDIAYEPSGWCCGIDEIFVYDAGKPIWKFVKDLDSFGGESTYRAEFFGKKWVTVMGCGLNEQEVDMWSEYVRSYEGITWFSGTKDYVCSSNIDPSWDHAFTVAKNIFNLETFPYTPPMHVIFGPDEE